MKWNSYLFCMVRCSQSQSFPLLANFLCGLGKNEIRTSRHLILFKFHGTVRHVIVSKAHFDSLEGYNDLSKTIHAACVRAAMPTKLLEIQSHLSDSFCRKIF